MADETTTPDTQDAKQAPEGSILTLTGVEKARSAAIRAENKKPGDIRDKDWRKARIEAGHMVILRSHFKSIFLIPMVLISLICGIAVVMGGDDASPESQWFRAWGLVWAFSFMFYMGLFIFEWSRAWTVVLIGGIVSVICICFAINSDSFPVWQHLWDVLKGLNLQLSVQAYFFFAIFFAFCVGVSWLKTRMHYVVMEHNEMQIYRNAFFGDRERISMLNPRIEVLVPDMIEYFHPFYRAGTVVIHAPNKTIVLENVLKIREIERVTDRLGSTLSVRVETD